MTPEPNCADSRALGGSARANFRPRARTMASDRM